MTPRRLLIISLLAYAVFFMGVLGRTPVGAGPSAWGKSAQPVQSYARTVIERDFVVTRIGQIGAMETRDKLVILYELLRQKESKKAALTLKGKVVQGVGDNLYIVSCSGILIAVETSPDTVAKPDGSIEMLIKPDGFFEHTDAAGAVKTIRRYKYQTQPDYEFTREDFVSRLKHGELFIADTKESGTCRQCSGIKYIGSKLDGTSQVCPLCNGTGVEKEQPVRYKIRW